ncbi:MAG: hypothetical protein HQK70_02900 [Desulfamplus sp.]|nr:hypothetical protein [Desulfamplus sp.]
MNISRIIKLNRRPPIQILSVGFILISLIGGILLSLPVSSCSGEMTPFTDAVFTASSAVTTTGLIVVDTGSYYSMFGQIVIMILIQIGGLGYMLFFVFFVLLLGNELSMKSTLLLRESVKRPFTVEVTKFTIFIIAYTFITELVGAILLAFYLSKDFPLSEAIYSAIFHSISAFNTAGFSIYVDSFVRYNNNILLHIIVNLICIAGCIGFCVVFDSFEYIYNTIKKKRPNTLSVHSKLVYFITIALSVTGTLIVYFAEYGDSDLSFKEKTLNSSFQVLTAVSTTGFNTIDIGKMSETSLFLLTGLMFIGSGSGSTGGGIKIPTFGVLLSLLYSVLKQKEEVNIFKRRVSSEVIRHSLAIGLLSGLWMFIATLVLSATKSGTFIQVLFEVGSALGTVGLSTGITANLTFIGKWVIIITMLIGRIGPLGIGLSVGLSLFKQQKDKYQYPIGDIYVG